MRLHGRQVLLERRRQFEGGRIRHRKLLHRGIKNRGQRLAVALRGRGVQPGLLQFVAVLGQQRFAARDHHAGQAHDEVGFLLCGQHKGDRAAFAVAEDAHAVEALAKQREAGGGIVLQVFRRHVHHVAGRFAEAPVVVAQGRHAPAGQIVGDDGKRLVFKDFFVPVLETASGDQ